MCGLNPPRIAVLPVVVVMFGSVTGKVSDTDSSGSAASSTPTVSTTAAPVAAAVPPAVSPTAAGDVPVVVEVDKKTGALSFTGWYDSLGYKVRETPVVSCFTVSCSFLLL